MPTRKRNDFGIAHTGLHSANNIRVLGQNQEMSQPPTEIEQALEIARKTRINLQSGKTALEQNIHGLYMVAQILGREEDREWAESELNGYDGDCPPYRVHVGRMFLDKRNDQIEVLIKGAVSQTTCRLSIIHVEKLLDPKYPRMASFVLTDEDINSVDNDQKEAIENIPSITWRFHNDALLRVLTGSRLELVRRINSIIAEIMYGKIPEGIFKKFQDKVNTSLARSNPAAISELNTAYENLARSGDPEKAAHVAFSCRRLIRAVADELFPPRDQAYTKRDKTTMEVGKDCFLNRLDAYVDSLGSGNRIYLARKIGLLRDAYGNVPQSVNKGTHDSITQADAEMLVIYSYLILGEILLEAKDGVPGRQKSTRRSSARKPAAGGAGSA